MLRFLRAAVIPPLLLGLQGVAGAQTEHWVHPVFGSDTAGDGSQGNPFKTISFAVLLGATGQLTLHLYPGTYSESTGESFPIVLPPQVEVLGVDPCGALIRHNDFSTFTFDAVFRIDNSSPPAGTAIATFRDLEIFSWHRGIQMEVNSTLGSLLLIFENVKMFGYQAILLTVNEDAQAALQVIDCDFESDQSGIKITQFKGAQTDVIITGSILSTTNFASGATVDLFTNGVGSNVNLTMENTVTHRAVAGLRSQVGAGSTVNSFISNCVFYDHNSGIVDTTAVAGSTPKHVVANSIFYKNDGDQDMPSYDPSRYTLSHNLVQQASLVGIGGDITGTPDWVDVGARDFHQLSTSPTIDAGDGAFASLEDFDGDPRVNVLAGSGVIDIGPDEFYDPYLWMHPASPKIGQTIRIRVFGPAGQWYAVGWALAASGSFGSGLPQLVNPSPTLLASGVVPSGGMVDVPFTVPDIPTIAGVLVYEQAVFLDPPTGAVSYTPNVFDHTLCN